MASDLRYWAFISYSHADEKWGRWLHKAIESYKVPARLVRHGAADAALPKRLFPVFRDRDELGSAPELGREIETALADSRNLVVVCSPASAQSKWVNEEIRYFKSLGRADRVYCLIVDGEPGDASRECFPPAIRFQLADDGGLSEQPAEPIAADARPQGDGKTNALLKLVSGMLGVGFDQLKQRDLAARNRRLTLIAGLAAGVAAVTVALAAYALQQRERAEKRREQAESLVLYLIDDLSGSLRGVGRIDLIANVAQRAVGYFDGLEASEKTPLTQLNELQARVATVVSDRTAGASSEQSLTTLDRYIEGLTQLAQDHPELAQVHAALANAYSVRANLGSDLASQSVLGESVEAGLAALDRAGGASRFPGTYVQLAATKFEWLTQQPTADNAGKLALFRQMQALAKTVDEALASAPASSRPNVSNLLAQAVAYRSVAQAAISLPKDTEPALGSSRREVADGYTDRMIANLNQVLEQVPTHTAALSELAYAYLLRAANRIRVWNGEEAARNGRLSRELYERLDLASPNFENLRQYLSYALQAEAAGQYLNGHGDEALRTIRRSNAILAELTAQNPSSGGTAMNWLADLTGCVQFSFAVNDLQSASACSAQAMKIVRNPPDPAMFEARFAKDARERTLADAAELYRVSRGRLGENVADELGDLLFPGTSQPARLAALRAPGAEIKYVKLRWLLATSQDALAATLAERLWTPKTWSFYEHQPLRSACERGWLPRGDWCRQVMAQPPPAASSGSS